jgi:hypothetical protein
MTSSLRYLSLLPIGLLPCISRSENLQPVNSLTNDNVEFVGAHQTRQKVGAPTIVVCVSFLGWRSRGWPTDPRQLHRAMSGDYAKTAHVLKPCRADRGWTRRYMDIPNSIHHRTDLQANSSVATRCTHSDRTNTICFLRICASQFTFRVEWQCLRVWPCRFLSSRLPRIEMNLICLDLACRLQSVSREPWNAACEQGKSH